MRLDRFIAHQPHLSRQDANLLISAGRVQVDHHVRRDNRLEVNEFSHIALDGTVLQNGKPARYYMLHKPAGYVSATCHDEHPTLLDLLTDTDTQDLHIGGRLDLTTTGLLLITNDGRWSRRLTQPGSALGKVYYVETEKPIGPEYAEAFATGLYFAYENLTTRPAQLQVLGSHAARLTLYEGRYHQVKRMFGHFRNRVTRLHRERMGFLQLDPLLECGSYRALNSEEIRQV